MSDDEMKLDAFAEYGMIPFDYFLLEHWDYNLPNDQDQSQWERLVQQYLELSPADRQPYCQIVRRVNTGPHPDWSPPNLTAENIDRVLRPFQTVKERNASAMAGKDNVPWLRICYDPELEDQYQQLVEKAELGEGGSVEDTLIFDDGERYDFGQDLDGARKRLLERVPGICDQTSDSEPAAELDLGAEHSLQTLGDSLALPLYVVDREAIAGQFVRVMWLDARGRTLRMDRLNPDFGNLTGLSSELSEGFSLEEVVVDRLPAYNATF